MVVWGGIVRSLLRMARAFYIVYIIVALIE